NLRVSYDSGNANLLRNGVAVAGITGQRNSTYVYKIEVPEGASNLVVTTDGAEGDSRLFVRYGSPATPSENDCADNGGSGTGRMCALIATPGTWYVLVDTDYFMIDVHLTASYGTGNANLLQNGVPVTGLTGVRRSAYTYKIDVPAGA